MCIWELEAKILNSTPLSSGEMRVVEDALLSEEISQRVLACEALLRLGDEQQKDDAVQELSRTVHDINSGRGELTSNLLMTFFSLPLSVLNQSHFQVALRNAASHTDDGVRGNCMIAIGPLAKAGNKWAEEVLRDGLRDPDDHVRQNARVGFKLVHNGKT